jgi:hypothetical protein
VRVADVDALTGPGDVESRALTTVSPSMAKTPRSTSKPRSLRVEVLMPARVPMRSGAASMSARPVSTRYFAKTRVPLPHISAADPSALR